jgi:hypothetical protein
MPRAVEVFTPNDVPTFSYVERTDKFEDRLREALSVPKMIISLSGPSKSGKTVLVKKVIGENLIPLSGATIRSGDALWSKILGWMAVPDQRTEKTETAISVEASANAGGKIGVPLVAQGEAKAGGKLGGERTYGEEKTVHQGGLAQVIANLSGAHRPQAAGLHR